MPFQPGHKKVGGRTKGTPDKRYQIARMGVTSAVALLRDEKFNPIVFQREINSLMRRVGLKLAAGNDKAAERDMDRMAERIAAMPSAQSRLCLDWLKEARDGYYRLAQFAYPKLATINMSDPTMQALWGNARHPEAAVVMTEREIVFMLRKRGMSEASDLIEAEADEAITAEEEPHARSAGNGRGNGGGS